MAATYDVIVQEAKVDLDKLTPNHYQLQVAKSVSSPGGAPTFNVVYSSQFLGPTMSVAWKVQYGLNWMTTVPNAGSAIVNYGGNWQACSQGQSWDLDQSGLWVANNKDPKADPNSLNIGNNGYQSGVNVVVGVQNPDASWSPIWVDPNQLLQGANGQYQPRESVQIWYQEGSKTATMISGQATPVDEWDMTNTPTYYFYYNTTTGKWLQQPTTFVF